MLPLAKRCCRTDAGLRQYHSIDPGTRQQADGNWLVEEGGTVARSTLMEKLLLLCAIKAATLDSAGMGVEMDDGKPFDPLAAAEPDTTLSAEERNIGGLGVFLVKRMMDEMHYERRQEKNCLTLSLHLPGSPRP